MFLSKCDPKTKPEEVKIALIAESINVTAVNQINHNYSHVYASFVVTVEKNEDYIKLISGHSIPEGMCARRYFPPRIHRPDNSNSSFSRQLDDLQKLEDGVVSDPISGGSSQSSVVPMQVSDELRHSVSSMVSESNTASPPANDSRSSKV